MPVSLKPIRDHFMLDVNVGLPVGNGGKFNVGTLTSIVVPFTTTASAVMLSWRPRRPVWARSGSQASIEPGPTWGLVPVKANTSELEPIRSQAEVGLTAENVGAIGWMSMRKSPGTGDSVSRRSPERSECIEQYRTACRLANRAGSNVGSSRRSGRCARCLVTLGPGVDARTRGAWCSLALHVGRIGGQVTGAVRRQSRHGTIARENGHRRRRRGRARIVQESLVIGSGYP